MIKRLNVTERITLDQISDDDAHTLVKQIGDKRIYDNVLLVPYPYQLSDAISWVRFVEKQVLQYGHLVNWTIRLDGNLIGGIGMHKKYSIQTHKDEIGYWIGADYWGQGIMSKVLNTFCDHAFRDLGLKRLEAPVYTTNTGSQRVLEKNGFEREGLMRKAYFKDETYLDAFLYARTI